MPWVRVETNIPGYTVGVYRPRVPRISSALLDCVAYLYESKQDAKDGRRPGASGLLYPMAYSDSCRVRGIHVYVVTNAHVALYDPKAYVVRLRRRDGEPIVIDPGLDAWVQHPDGDDLAVCPLRLDSHDAYRLVTPRHHWKMEPGFTDEEGEFLGREVVMVGRFLDIEGRETSTPTLRFGNISSPRVETIRHFSGINQESFLVEMRSLPGYSGSPVFVLPDPWEQVEVDPLKRKLAEWARDEATDLYPDLPKPIRDPRDLHLLGITWGHVGAPRKLVDREGREQNSDLYAPSHSGMTGVVPWWKIWEMLDESEFKEERKKIEDKAEHDVRSVALDQPTPSVDPRTPRTDS